jgi:hypothetical protein
MSPPAAPLSLINDVANAPKGNLKAVGFLIIKGPASFFSSRSKWMLIKERRRERRRGEGGERGGEERVERNRRKERERGLSYLPLSCRTSLLRRCLCRAIAPPKGGRLGRRGRARGKRERRGGEGLVNQISFLSRGDDGSRGRGKGNLPRVLYEGAEPVVAKRPRRRTHAAAATAAKMRATEKITVEARREKIYECVACL